jgi:ATP-binding cassette subfamily A (ABC1) protein 3
MSFKIPYAHAPKFKEFFALLDNSLSELKLRSYGISVTTLEEVFLKVGHGEKDEKLKEKKKELGEQN